MIIKYYYGNNVNILFFFMLIIYLNYDYDNLKLYYRNFNMVYVYLKENNCLNYYIK